MLRSEGRIRITQQGTLPRPDDLRTLVHGRASGEAYDADALADRLEAAAAEVVRRQVEIGVDSIDDGAQPHGRYSPRVPVRCPVDVHRPAGGAGAFDDPDLADGWQKVLNPTRLAPQGCRSTP